LDPGSDPFVEQKKKVKLIPEVVAKSLKGKLFLENNLKPHERMKIIVL
jgi:hypothetical protein